MNKLNMPSETATEIEARINEGVVLLARITEVFGDDPRIQAYGQWWLKRLARYQQALEKEKGETL